jgi:amino acid adenylation domain-containing protein/non-ribosomal peptide synthase protein (TIGR01720 family)
MSAQTAYPLSPLQQGMLFHALAEPCSGVDVEQLVFTLREAVDAERLRAAWERVVARHGILRTAFRWDGAEPVQEVHESVELPFAVEEADGMDDGDFAAWLHVDRVRGFAMDAAPLMRFLLLRHGDAHWRLVWTFHHALLDGRSFPRLIEEAFGFYDAPDAAEPPVPRAYGDFIAWQAAQVDTGAEAFWRERLQGFRAATPLAIEGLGEVAAQREQGDAETMLDAETTKRLKALAGEREVTLNTLVQAAWAVLLGRYSGEEDVCFGATRVGRSQTVEGAEKMVGLFINTVPVRVQVAPERKLGDVLRELREGWLAMRRHEHTPLARVQTWSEVPAGKPLFRTLVVFENYDLAAQFRARGGAWERRELRLYEQTNFPICLAAYAGERLRLVAEYDRSQLDESLVKALLGHVRTLLAAMPEHHEGTVGDLPMVPAEEAAELLADQRTNFPAEETLQALFAAQAARTPEATALVQGDTRMTYGELDSRAHAVATHLAKLGVGTETVVGLCMERCPELVVGLMGILKANAAYLPIDLAYPPERLAFMLKDAQAPVLLTQRHLADRLPPGHGAKLVFMEDIAEPVPNIVPLPGTAGQLGYVLYTSGSTGKPKGCGITHRNVARLFTATEAWFHFGANDVWTLFHSTAFDFSVWEIWGALLHGGTLVVVPFEVSRSPEQFHELLVREKVTVLNQTPSAFRQLMAADATSARSAELSLRHVIFGGEALEMRTLQPWFEKHSDAQPRLVNMYGITETTVHVTYRPISADDVARGSVIGVPIPDLQLLVLDARLRPVPMGVPGELLVGGAGLARGYHRRPELTAERFIAHPVASGERLYRTGDLVRRLPGGDLEYLGRIDQQVKIRGFRIELGEIESVLLQHPRVREAAVLARDDGHGGKKLVAWVVENAAAPEASAGALRAHLKKFLPDYMVPAAFVWVAQMPLTNNGKLDARALPEPPEERAATVEFVAPGSEAEKILAEIWERVLKLQRVGIHDNFFELGGDSILTILVVSQARQRGLTLTPKMLFDHPTIAMLAEHAGTEPANAPPLPEGPAEGEVPLTPIQRWFFGHEFAEPHHWNQGLVLTLTKTVSRQRLAAALQKAAAAHPVFRLCFERTAAGWQQRFTDRKEAGFKLVAGRVALHRSLNLAGPLAAWAYDDASGELSLAIHHLIVDGVSWRVFLEDLDAALRGVPLPERTTGFHTWARAAAQARSTEEDRAYWRALPSSAPLPRDLNGGENVESSARIETRTFDAGITTTLLRDLPMQDALLAALAHALAKVTGQSEHVVEIEGHGREEATLAELTGSPEVADLSHAVGWFTTIYPVRLRIGNSPAETLAETSAHLAAVPRKGFGAMLADDGKKNAEVLFNYLGQFDQTAAGLEHFRLADLETAGWHAPAGRRTHVLEVNCLVVQGRLKVRWGYSANLHRRETIVRMAETFAGTLRALLMTPARFPLAKLDAAGLARIAARYPAMEAVYPLSPMQRLFLALEAARPGAGTDQWQCRLVGPLNARQWQTAWAQLTRRHAALRTAYLAEMAEPLQVVVPDAAPAWHVSDLRGVPAPERTARVNEYRAKDAARPFDVTRAPLTRLALFRIGEEEHIFVWTHHHLEIDGWSWPVVFRELHGILTGRIDEAAKPAPRYRDYIAWLARQPNDREFWLKELGELRNATPLPLREEREAKETEVSVVLKAEESAKLLALARKFSVTPNVLVQAAWAMLLAHHASLNDVVFGAAFSGRPAELPGADEMIGHFVNNLPVRVQLAPEQTLAECVRGLQDTLAKLTEHQHTPLAEIETCSDLPWNARLFSTLLVFQNYLGAETQLGEARVVEMHAPVRTNYPLTLVVNPGESFRFTWIAKAGIAGAGALNSVAEQLIQLLRAFETGAAVRDLSGQLPPRVVEPRVRKPSAPSVSSAPGDTTTELERKIAGVWREAFGRVVSVNENFFDLGGHSLLMLRMHLQLKELLGIEITIIQLFQYPTIRALAQALGDAPGAGPSPAIVAAQERAAKAREALARRPLMPRKT